MSTYKYISTIQRNETTGSNSSNTGIKSLDLTNDLIRNIPIEGDIRTNSIIESVTISVNTGNNWQGYHRARFRLELGSNKIYSSWMKGLYTNGSYQRVELSINFPSQYTVDNFNEEATKRLYLETQWESGAGTLWYYGKIGEKSYIQYNFGDSIMIFLKPAVNSEYNQYVDNLNVIIPNKYYDSGQPPYDIILLYGNDDIETKKWDSIEDNEENTTAFNFGTLAHAGSYTVRCIDNNNIEQNSVKINVLPNDIVSVVSEITRYKTEEGTETDFLGEYVEIKLTISTLISSFLNKSIKIKINDNIETEIIGGETRDVEHTLSSQFIVNYKQRQQCNPSYSTNISIEIYLVENSTAIFSSEIIVPSASPIFNIEDNGIGIGQFSTGTSNDKKFECAWPAYFYKGINVQDVTNELLYYGTWEDNDENTQTGMTNIWSNSISFQTYSGSDGSAPKLVICGNVACFSGIITPKEDIAVSGTALICLIPKKYLPNNSVIVICQGSSENIWTLRIDEKYNGSEYVDYTEKNNYNAVWLSRYRTGATYNIIEAPSTNKAGSWLPFSTSWIIPNENLNPTS